MSHSNTNDTFMQDDVPIHSVFCTLTQTMNVEVTSDTSVASRKNTMVTTQPSLKTLSPILCVGITKTKLCTTAVEMAELILPLISKQFTIT